MSWSTSVISTVSSDTEPTVVINFDSAKYIFNAGENTGRTWLQSRHHWRKTKGLFLTSLGTQRGSGVPGLVMFLADAGQPKLDIVGPQGLNHYIASMRGYVYRDNMVVTTTEGNTSELMATSSAPSPMFKDDNLTVYGIPIHEDIQSSDVPMPDSPQKEASETLTSDGKRKREQSPGSPSKRLRDEDGEWQPVESIHQRMRSDGFCPATLQGSDAEEWRKLIVKSMFPKRPPPPSEKSAKKGKTKQKREEEPVPESPGKKKFLPSLPHRERGLPYFLPSGQSKPTLCYVCVGPKVRGRFDAAKAEQLGLRGHLRGKVASGQTVSFMVEDGQGGQIERTVRPEQCVGPTEQPKVVIILDVPSTAHIPSLMRTFSESPFYRRFRSHLKGDKQEYNVHGVFHICGEGVLEDPQYKQFMKGFAEHVHHVVASREHTPDSVTFTSVTYNQLKLNALDPDMFPVPKYNLQPQKALTDVLDLPKSTTLMRSGLMLEVRPPKAPYMEKIALDYDHFHPCVTGARNFGLPDKVLEAFKDAREMGEADEQAFGEGPKPGDDVVIVPLGTSSASPSKYRNVSSTLVSIPKWGKILLDCGEGTWGQLARLYGNDPARSEGVWQALRELKCIFLSHMHGDHHIGLAKVLAMRRRMNPPPSEPLYVVGLRGVLQYLHEQSQIEDLGLGQPDGKGAITILSDSLNWKPPRPYWPGATMDSEPFMDIDQSRKDASQMGASLGLHNFITVDVNHRTRCYGCVIQHSDNWSVVFSADTMPTHNLVRAGQGATMLIHEATMGDDQVDMAKEKAHSTFGQAIDIGKRMNARNTLLTHFSARYPKMPPEGNPVAPGADGPIIGLAFDHATIPIGKMRYLRAYLPAIEQIFAETAMDEGDAEVQEEVYQVLEEW